jgi:hypothetical protein
MKFSNWKRRRRPLYAVAFRYDCGRTETRLNTGGKVRTPNKIDSSIFVHVMENMCLKDRRNAVMIQINPKWNVPMHTYLKVNTDGAF